MMEKSQQVSVVWCYRLGVIHILDRVENSRSFEDPGPCNDVLIFTHIWTGDTSCKVGTFQSSPNLEQINCSSSKLQYL